MDKRTKVRSGLYFGITLTIFFICKDMLTQDSLAPKNFIITIISGLFGGAIAGLLFGWLLGQFANAKFFTKGTKITTETGESILFETAATHFIRTEGVGGKLYLTDKRLVFKSHKFNIQNHELSMYIPDIEKVNRYKTLGITNNGLSVTTAGNSVEKFAVQQPDQWFNYLTGRTVPPR